MNITVIVAADRSISTCVLGLSVCLVLTMAGIVTSKATRENGSNSMIESIFANYWNEVTNLLGGKPNRSLAISLGEYPPPLFDGAAIV